MVTSGPVPADASPLFGSPRLEEFINWIKEQYDVAVFDSSPVLSVVDPSLLAGKLDGCLLVIDASAQMRSARSAVAALRRTGSPLVGAVLNKVTAEGGAYPYSNGKGYYPYGGGNGSDGTSGHRWDRLGRYARPILALGGRLYRRRGG